MEIPAVYEGKLEIRQSGAARVLAGRFPYDAVAVVSDRGRGRKERIAPRAFEFAVSGAGAARPLELLAGHSFDRPLASRQAGTLKLQDSAEALTFEATLPAVENSPSWILDAVKAVELRLVLGISPGFVIPPKSVVPNAETFEPEPGNPGVQVRVIHAAVLRELSLVTSPAYRDSSVDLRAEDFGVQPPPKRIRLWR